MRSISPGSARSCRPLRNWIGSSAAIYAPISLGDPDPENISKQAGELVALAPDVIVAAGTSTVGPVLQATRTIPVVFPIGRRSGRRRLRRQFGAAGRQCHGIPSVRIQPGRKRLELLKRIAPGVTRVAVIRDPTTPSGFGQFAAIQAVSPSLGMEIEPVNMRDKQEIEGAIATFADAPNGGMILSGSSRAMIIELAARHKLPTVYYERFYAAAGGLISYGADRMDQYRRAAGYVDRILRGEKPGDLPVQAPTKYELVINLETAKALGLEVPPPLLSSADEVIE